MITNQQIVMLPGLGFSAEVFQHLALDGGLSIELPGFPGDARQTFTSPVEWVQTLLPRLPLKAHYLGWSLGGAVACYLAKHFPERVQSLVLVASSPRLLAADHWPGVTPENWAFFSDSQLEVLKAQKRLLALQGDAACRRALKALQWQGNYAGWQQGLAVLANWDFRNWLAETKIPWCGLYGGQDALLTGKLGDEMKRAYPKHMVKIVANGTHALLQSSPGMCLEMMREFWCGLA